VVEAKALDQPGLAALHLIQADLHAGGRRAVHGVQDVRAQTHEPPSKIVHGSVYNFEMGVYH
jgi:hypothetical protein